MIRRRLLLAGICPALPLYATPVISMAHAQGVAQGPAHITHITIVSNPTSIGAYRPATVVVHRGWRVVFSNRSNAVHTVTENKGRFDSGNIQVGHSWTFTARHTGTFRYYCLYHPLMHGTLIVKP